MLLDMAGARAADVVSHRRCCCKVDLSQPLQSRVVQIQLESQCGANVVITVFLISKDCGNKEKRFYVFLYSHQAGICTAPGFCGKFGLPDGPQIELGQNAVFSEVAILT